MSTVQEVRAQMFQLEDDKGILENRMFNTSPKFGIIQQRYHW